MALPPRGTGTDRWTADAALDPWLLVSDDPDSPLYGYAEVHPSTGGLAWTVTTPVQHFDIHRGRAVTASGRRYRLGRRIEVSTLPDREARFAYVLLVAIPLGLDADALLGGTHPRLAAEWVRACKMARHLGIAPPGCERDAVLEFLHFHADRYVAVLRSKLGS
jgi:hypothetical protein